MRKTSVRKFIHMVIDILPLLIIPIFALNILHKETEPISIEVQENKILNFNQNIKNGNFENTNDWIVYNNTTLTVNNNIGSVVPQIQFSRIYQQYTWTENNIYYIKFDYSVQNTGWILQSYANNTWYITNISLNTTENSYSSRFTMNANGLAPITFQYNGTQNYGTNILTLQNVQLFNLTQMYGVGNEPQIETFEQDFNDEYYNFTYSQNILVEDYISTYNSTDIGSQFIYALYKPVHDYFNFNNLFNMGAIYDWIQLNLFSGTAPLPIFIIWNVIVYEFFVDLIFLLYGVFMFIIDFAEKCLERPFGR